MKSAQFNLPVLRLNLKNEKKMHVSSIPAIGETFKSCCLCCRKLAFRFTDFFRENGSNQEIFPNVNISWTVKAVNWTLKESGIFGELSMHAEMWFMAEISWRPVHASLDQDDRYLNSGLNISTMFKNISVAPWEFMQIMFPYLIRIRLSFSSLIKIQPLRMHSLPRLPH